MNHFGLSNVIDASSQQKLLLSHKRVQWPHASEIKKKYTGVIRYGIAGKGTSTTCKGEKIIQQAIILLVIRKDS
jgi:hypothetical protein